MSTPRTWQAYWNGKTTPLHRHDTEEFYARHARELASLYWPMEPGSVLEIGCGNGALYTHMGFDRADSYKGVDFSETMIAEFRKRLPGLDLECRDGSAYRDERKYDLIFSNGVVQYFDPEMMRNHMENVRSMLGPGSVCVCGSITWRARRFGYYSGELGGQFKRSYVSAIRSLAACKLKGDPLGFWYDPGDIREFARQHGMSADIYASMHYLYRFHAVLKLA